jgi:type I restriction enzyme S subunit
LERLARAIFRAWFVDFEPVHAKAAGATSFPSMPQSVFDSLPTRFTDSELGPIPAEWEVKQIGDVVTVKGGGTPSTKIPDYWEGGEYCWATPKDMSRLSDPIILDTERRITDAGVAKVSSGLLPAGTVLLSSRAPVGYLAITAVPMAVNQGFIAMICDRTLPPIFVFHWTQSALEEIKGRASGTTFPEISKTVFRPIQVVVPPSGCVDAFAKIVQSMFDKVTANIRESAKLVELRDYLLPKLLSGQVRVGDAERLAEEVA